MQFDDKNKNFVPFNQIITYNYKTKVLNDGIFDGKIKFYFKSIEHEELEMEFDEKETYDKFLRELSIKTKGIK